jgi:aspartyl-tRNA synthetase
LNLDLQTPFKRMPFQDAINRYGIDKPDTRFGMEIEDFTEEFRGSTFKVSAAQLPITVSSKPSTPKAWPAPPKAKWTP